MIRDDGSLSVGRCATLACLIEATVPKEVIAEGCLLCSEDKPHHCHRRLVAEYLKDHWGDIEIAHIE